jgi:hypothetical protein
LNPERRLTENMKRKLVLSIDDSIHNIAQRSGNSSQYLSDLLSRNWVGWQRALAEAQRAGWNHEQIVGRCIELNGSWLLDGISPATAETRGKRPPAPGAAVCGALELLAWEYWHNNEELRAILSGKKAKRAEADPPAPAAAPAKKRGPGRPPKAKA